MREVTGREPLKWYALFALTSAMFAVAGGYGIVLSVLPFLVEQQAGRPLFRRNDRGLVPTEGGDALLACRLGKSEIRFLKRADVA